MTSGFDPRIMELAVSLGHMRAALIRCGVEGPFVMHIPATKEGFDLSMLIKSQPVHGINRHHEFNMDLIRDQDHIGFLCDVELRFYEVKGKR